MPFFRRFTVNFSDMMKMKGAWDKFSSSHPQFVRFLSYMASSTVTEGTVFRLSVQRPGEEKEVRTSIAINESDLELIELLKSMARK